MYQKCTISHEPFCEFCSLNFIIVRNIFLFYLAIYSLPLTAQVSLNAGGGDVNNSNGSISSSIGQVFFQVHNNGDFNIQDGVQQPYEISSVDIEENVLYDITVFPNPTTNALQISWQDNSFCPSALIMTDAAGKEIYSVSDYEKMQLIDMFQFAPGTYFLTIRQRNHLSRTFKIIKN